MDIPKDLQQTFEELIVPIIEDKFLFMTNEVFTNEVYTGYTRKPLRKRRDLTPFGFEFYGIAIEVHPLSTEYSPSHPGGCTRILCWAIKGHRTFNMGIIEVSHTAKERDLDI